MIQRIQSLYLLLAALCFFVLLMLDLPYGSPAAADAWFTPFVMIGAVLLGLASLGSILLYKNREQQLRVINGVQLAAVAFLIVFFGGLYFAGDLHFQRGGATDAEKVVSLFLPILGYVMLFLARRGVAADIALVRSMDRLR